ncbi:metal-dependent hydrolase [Paenibacillus swuensis]|uniref:Putative metal-dependent hydrolase SY83_15765 n=1 Tax=Paenibacillus swuensis TaxID=1178515 RepID=A0A172TKK1_9BACL|nr:bacillithiol transferase BstA [Paenibacillus swuensis]ANE47496.1 metal-dependent hydrolase [Paenibacillus swuensis]
MKTETDLRYPIGKFVYSGPATAEQCSIWIHEIAALPTLLAEVLEGLTQEQLDTPYREGGWTPRQVTHHLADSHINSYVRFKLALTEEMPVIKPYEEQLWAELPDSSLPVEVSLRLLMSLHKRWTVLLRSLGEQDLARTLLHPESGEHTVESLIGLYAWHGLHHVAHIADLREREGWNK